MAFLSLVDLAGSAGQSNFTFAFPYIAREHIHVYLNGTETFAFTFNSDFVVHLTSPLGSAATVRIQRTTPSDEPLVDYVNGATLGETDLDTSTLQVLYIMQEVTDLANGSIEFNLRVPTTDIGGVDELPNAAARASSFLYFDANGQPTVSAWTGNTLAFAPTTQLLSGTGAQLTFTLASPPGSSSAIVVAISGVVQKPLTDFLVSGTSLTFSTAPPSGTNNIMVQNFGVAQLVNTVNAGQISGQILSTQVDHTNAAANAITRSLSNILSERKSVDDFGAIGDGVTDDTLAFQRAADAGGRIFVPGRAYIVDYLDVTTNCLFEGEGSASIIRKKPNSVSTSYANSLSYLFNTVENSQTLVFKNLSFDGNYLNQTLTRTGSVPANTGQLVGANVPSATVMAVGGVLNMSNRPVSTPGSQMHIVFSECQVEGCVTEAIYIVGELNTSSVTFATIDHCVWKGSAPGIINYHDGVTSYPPGVVLPISGYSFSTNGVEPSFVKIVDNARVIFTNNFVYDLRDPYAGTLTTGFPWNTLNLTNSALHVTILEGTTQDDPLDWSSVIVANNYFENMGRFEAGINGIGVLDMYARAGNVSITGNVFKNCNSSCMRGKVNAKNVTITGNVVDNDVGHLFCKGINIGPLTYPSQQGYYTITGNTIKGTSVGISVEGLNPPPENADAGVADDDDNAVNNVIITGNQIFRTVNDEFANAVLQPPFAVFGQGIRVEDCAGIVVSNNIVDTTIASTGSSAEEAGIRIRNTTGPCTVSGNNVLDTSKQGIVLLSHTGKCIVSGNMITRSGTAGISGSYTGDALISGNFVDDCLADSGIIATTSGATSCVLNGNVVTSTTVDLGATISGITASGSTAAGMTLHIQNNHIKTVTNAGAGNAYGINISLNATPSDNESVIVTGNTVDGTDQSGIFLTDVTGIIANNVLKNVNTAADTAHGGLFFNGVTNIGKVTVRDNTVEGTTMFPTTGGASYLSVHEHTIATGAITVNLNDGVVIVDTEADAATDDLDTINGTQDGQVITFRASVSTRDVVFRDGTGNMKLAGDFTANNLEDTITLRNSGGTLYEMCRSDNGA